MLQFITTVSSRFSVLEEVQMVLEGGCRWIQLAQSGFAGDESAIRDVAMEIVPMCQEKEAFFIIEDDLDLVEEMKCTGFSCTTIRGQASWRRVNVSGRML